MLKYKNRTNLHGQFLHFFKIYFPSASGHVSGIGPVTSEHSFEKSIKSSYRAESQIGSNCFYRCIVLWISHILRASSIRYLFI